VDYPTRRVNTSIDHLLCEKGRTVMINLLTPVALITDIPEHSLSRGQIGTVVEHLRRDGEHALLVEFSDGEGQTLAIVPVREHDLIVLHRNTHAA
jgi:hypothetical protein